MVANVTERQKVMSEIQAFVMAVVEIAEMKDVDAAVRAKAIVVAEQVLCEIIMNKMVKKCSDNAVACNN